MKNVYQQKADPKILKECEEFIEKYKDSINDKEVGSKAIHKTNKLIQSLADCEDLKEMNNEIRIREEKKMLENTDFNPTIAELNKEIRDIHSRFHEDKYANEVIKQLEEIQNKNCK